MQQLSLYSGNMTDAPNGYLLTEQFDSRSYVRLYCDVNTGSASTLPISWVFILVILGLVLGIISLTSSLMYLVQWTRRLQLRRLISNGQVDLEALGIKQLKVPQQVLDQLPLFVYVAQEQAIDMFGAVGPCGSASTSTIFEGTHGPRQFPLEDRASPTEAQPPQRPDAKGSLPSPDTLPHLQLPYNQTNCPICLEDFVSHRTIVRKLPCPHIYHPECVDPVLQEYSSLCPYCKETVLPVGYCPTEITNDMVRLERNIRRIRERVTVESHPAAHVANLSGRPFAMRGRIASFHRQFRVGNRRSSRNSAAALRPVELRSFAAAPELASPNRSATSAMAHRTTSEHHVGNLALGHQEFIDLDEEQAHREASQPRCK